jgi:hypothetical protein
LASWMPPRALTQEAAGGGIGIDYLVDGLTTVTGVGASDGRFGGAHRGRFRSRQGAGQRVQRCPAGSARALGDCCGAVFGKTGEAEFSLADRIPGSPDTAGTWRLRR